MKNRLLLWSALSFFCTLLSAQQKTEWELFGLVVDHDTEEPLPFARICIFDDGELVYGAESDLEGFFELSSIGDSIEFTYVGYNAKKQAIADLIGCPVITLQSKNRMTDEIVVTISVPFHNDVFTPNDDSAPQLTNDYLAESKEQGRNWRIFPTPAVDIIYIQTDDDTEGEISILSGEGRVCLAFSCTSLLTRVDVSNLPAGHYRLRYSNEDYAGPIGSIVKIDR